MKKFGVMMMLVSSLMMVGLTGCQSQESVTNAGQVKVENKKEAPGKTVELLNVSYDPTRELYEAYNQAFIKYWEGKSGEKVVINNSHGGSGKQGRAVVEGLEADVVTLALGYDIEAISKAGLIEPGWQQEFEKNSSPYTSTIVFLVRKGNPKQIKDWDDLTREDVSVITPNPKTSGGARWNYLAAWGYGLEKYGNEDGVKTFVSDLYKRVEVLDSGARGATTTFVERGIGDVLITWENEAYLALNELGKDQYELIMPSISILAEPPVAIVDEVVKKHQTEDVAKAYLEYLYSDEGQEIITQNYYRPTNPQIAEKYKDQFKPVPMITIDEVFGGWEKAQQTHFADGGLFDQIYEVQK